MTLLMLLKDEDAVSPLEVASQGVQLAGVVQGVEVTPEEVAAMALIGPVSSPGGIWDAYVYFRKLLTSDEVLTGTPTVVSNNADVSVSQIGINPAGFTDITGKFIKAGKAVLFRITTEAELNENVTFDVDADTDSGEHAGANVAAQIVPRLTDTI